MDMHIANITEEVESLNTARTHILDEHMEAEELIEIINRFLAVYLTGTGIFCPEILGNGIH